MIGAILHRHKKPPIRKDKGKRIKDENKDPIGFRLILYPLSFSLYYSPNNFFGRWTTSGGWSITSFASIASRSPSTGSTGHLRLFASASKSGSLRVLLHASRRILTRSAVIPGGAVHGRPNSLGAVTNVASRRSASRVL